MRNNVQCHQRLLFDVQQFELLTECGHRSAGPVTRRRLADIRLSLSFPPVQSSADLEGRGEGEVLVSTFEHIRNPVPGLSEVSLSP